MNVIEMQLDELNDAELSGTNGEVGILIGLTATPLAPFAIAAVVVVGGYLVYRAVSG